MGLIDGEYLNRMILRTETQGDPHEVAASVLGIDAGDGSSRRHGDGCVVWGDSFFEFYD